MNTISGLVSRRQVVALATKAIKQLTQSYFPAASGCDLIDHACTGLLVLCKGRSGAHLLWVDRALDLVLIARWIDGAQFDALIATVLGQMR